LSAVLALNKALHFAPVVMRYWLNVDYAAAVYTSLRFYTVWADCRPSVASAYNL
jgi:hypothetical protein